MNWLHHLWFGYFWPSDIGNGPEAIQQTLVYACIALLFIPPMRRFERRLHAKLDGLHRKADHIIKYHPDIPDMPLFPE